MKILLSVALTLGFLGVKSEKIDIFSSIKELSRLIQTETEFIGGLEELADNYEESAKVIRKYLKFNKHEILAESEEKYVGNPINSINLIKRLGVQVSLSNLSTILENNSTEILKHKLHNLTKGFPDYSDWSGACNGVHLLQEHYSLNITQLADGIIQYENKTFTSEHTMGADELANIGIAANNDGFYDASIEWLSMAKKKGVNGKESDYAYTDNVAKIDSLIRDGKKIHDHILDHRGMVGPRHRCFALPFDSQIRRKKKYREWRKANDTARAEKPRNLAKLYVVDPESEKGGYRDNFEVVCKGVPLRTPDMETDKKCRLLHHDNPYLLAGPFKFEELSFEPYISLIHDLMYEPEIKYYKQYASDKLERSGHGGGAGSTTSLRRTSKQTWLEYRNFSPKNYTLIHEKVGGATLNHSMATVQQDYSWGSYFSTPEAYNATDKVASAVSDRIELATKFTLRNYYSGESFQIANYGLGGQYSEHLDPRGIWEGIPAEPEGFTTKTGDRLSTVMVYLADVEAGGATSFPLTGIRIPVQKGTAAFWINMLKSGYRDKLTVHGGCPVLLGSKWITNKWVGYSDQFRNYPCGTEGPFQRFSKFTAYY